MVKNDAEIFTRNRAAWNEALAYHRKARGDFLRGGFSRPDYTVFDRDCDGILRGLLARFNLRDKTIAQAPCNNGRELLSIMRLTGAAEGLGVDIADDAISEARELAALSGLNAEFMRANILDIDGSYDNSRDFIYISEGSLQWFPDLGVYFQAVARLLKEGGRLLIFEIHPLAYFIENALHPQETRPEYAESYFAKGPYGYPKGLDYVGGEEYAALPCFWYMHKLSDIINALIKSGFAIDGMEEYNTEMANDPAHIGYDKFPLSYSIIAQKIN